MKMMKLAFQNFKVSFKNYLSLIISLAFTILVLFNFLNLIDSGILNGLGESNARNIEIVIQVMSFVLGCFMLFFIWYATNVFLTKRKKEIGIYVFMGLTNQKIGKLYAIETIFLGLVALVLGVGFGIITSKLFVMITMAISKISVDISFHFSITPVLITAIIFIIIYAIFVLKGYISIVRSSVLQMVAANRQNEYVQAKTWLLVIKTILGIVIMATGYYFAIAKGGMETMSNALLAVVLVVIGVYFLFGGLIPFIYQSLLKNKRFLYQKQRNLWINNVVFRIKKNYRTYAMVCVLMICAVTALATGVAMNDRYNSIVHFENTYTYQILATSSNLDNEFKQAIEKENDVLYHSYIEILQLPDEATANGYTTAILNYSQLKKLAQDVNLEFNFKEPKNNEIIDVSKLYLLSVITDEDLSDVKINNKNYHQIGSTNEPYLGYFQEQMDFYVVNDNEYQNLKNGGTVINIYNYKIKDPNNFEASVNDLQENQNCQGLLKIDPQRSEIDWIKILFTVCIFMFMVFVLASGSIIFMKLYNDSFEERERYNVLKKIGISSKTLKKSIALELGFFYVMPLIVMTISSYFSIKALSNMMFTNLIGVNIISVLVIYVFFLICYILSIGIYSRNVKL